MPPPYVNPHWNIFAAIPHVSAGPINDAPAKWVVTHGLAGVPAGLPVVQLDRTQVRDICIDPNVNVLFGYICAMAWGGQGKGKGGSLHVQAAWTQQALLVQHLTLLRAGQLTRSQAYQVFLGAGNVPGLGPAYWTKLLYFFSPTANFYIMDQWASKSVNLLTGMHVVKMQGDVVAPNNKRGNYQAYCEEVDAMAALLGGIPGADVEEMLMSKGGRHPWPWRAHVKSCCNYDPARLHAVYPHIPLADF